MIQYKKPQIIEKPKRLKPCPFCGSQDVKTTFTEESGTWDTQCQGCGAMPYVRRQKDDVEALWNRRTNDEVRGD